MSIAGPTMWVIAFLAVLSIVPSSDCGNIDAYTDEEYYDEETRKEIRKNTRRNSPSCDPVQSESFALKLKMCKQVLSDDFFNTQRGEILDPNDEETYAELKRSNYYPKYRPDNTTLLENPYHGVKVVVRLNVFENFVKTANEHSVKDSAFMCLFRSADEPHHIQPFFLSPEKKFPHGSTRFRHIFVYNQQDEMVVLAKANDITIS